MTKEQMEVVRLHMRDTYDVAPWEWDSVELELAIYELITKSQAKNNKVLDLVSKRDFIKDDYVWFCGEINQVEAVKGNEVCIVELKGKLHQVVNKSELTNVC